MRLSDPNLDRERARYPNPLPSREWILHVLEQEGVPVAPEQLVQLLDIAADEEETFARRLNAMERDGQIMFNRRGAICIVNKLGLTRGRVQGHPDGYGFVIPDDGGPDLYLGPVGNVQGAARRPRDGAPIRHRAARAAPKAWSWKCWSAPTGAWSDGWSRSTASASWWPRTSASARTCWSRAKALAGAKPGQVVVAEIIQQPDRHIKPLGRVVEVLGNYADPGMEIEIALRKHDLPYEFPAAAQALAAKLPKTVRKTDLGGREDLRGLPLVTIDGETAKDFDDAVFCRPEGKGFRLWVAIADVSHYVRDGDALDTEARARGNSVYFPRRVIPMLPEELSNGLCSLNPEVDRLCMMCELVVDPRGEIKDYRFYPAVMHSQARLTYTTVAAALAGEADAVPTRAADRICRTCTGSTKCWSRRAGGAARSTSRRSRRAWSSTTRARSPRSTR